MKTMLKFIFVLFVMTTNISCQQNKVDNLTTFAKAYGYVKYFHPSDEAYNLNWEKFSAYGAKEVMKCNNRTDLIKTLNILFNPVAPAVKFGPDGNAQEYDVKSIIPSDTTGYRITYWQHHGVSFDIENPGKYPNIYKSVRVNRTPSDSVLFAEKPGFGKILVEDIGQGISLYLPLALYCNDNSTYPVADAEKAEKLKKELSSFDFNKEEQPMRLGNVINVYNVMKHFYPYFDVVDVNWDEELGKALTKTFSDKDAYDHEQTLAKLTAALKDGHANVLYTQSPRSYSLPLAWEWVEGKLVITENYSGNPDLHVGDIVTSVDGRDPGEYFKGFYEQISAPSEGWRNFKADRMSLAGTRNSEAILRVNGKNIKLLRGKRYYEYSAQARISKPYRIINDDICYLDMDQIPMDTVNKIMPLLEKSRAIILDARGYPKDNFRLITHLMNTDDTTSRWMQVPKIIYPDFKDVTWTNHNWIPGMKAQKPYLGDKKVIYIIDGSAISYAESCLGYIEGYKLATIIGQPSAGTNGNVNPFSLPGGYIVTWTGMKVVKHNGTQHHGVGIKPDIYVEKTIQGIKDGRDEFLEKAIEVAGGGAVL
jgi:hypothetical protein